MGDVAHGGLPCLCLRARSRAGCQTFNRPHEPTLPTSVASNRRHCEEGRREGAPPVAGPGLGAGQRPGGPRRGCLSGSEEGAYRAVPPSSCMTHGARRDDQQRHWCAICPNHLFVILIYASSRGAVLTERSGSHHGDAVWGPWISASPAKTSACNVAAWPLRRMESLYDLRNLYSPLKCVSIKGKATHKRLAASAIR